MASWRGRAARAVEARRAGALARLRGYRARWPWFDHLVRAYRRYTEQRGENLAAAVTFFGFLSFFPLVSLAYGLLGFLLGMSEAVREYLIMAVESILPGLTGQLDVDRVAEARTGAGVLGVAGLLVTGLGWVDALRQALRAMWRNDPGGGGGFLVKKLWDLLVVVALGASLIVSVAVSSLATSMTAAVLRATGLDGVTGAGTALRLLSVGVAMAGDTVIFLVLFSRLSGTREPWRRILRGALFGGIGFEVLKLVGTVLIGQTATNPVYASFALTVGLLVWINLVSRYTLLAAAWTATAGRRRSEGERPAVPAAEAGG